MQKRTIAATLIQLLEEMIEDTPIHEPMIASAGEEPADVVGISGVFGGGSFFLYLDDGSSFRIDVSYAG